MAKGKGSAAGAARAGGHGGGARAANGANEAPEAAQGEGAASEAGANGKAASAQGPRGHFMYVLECADATLYTGYAVDVAQRVAAHNSGRGAKYTRTRRPVRLVAAAAFATKHDAMSAEARFKRLSRPEKEALIAAAGEAGEASAFAAVLAERFGIALP